MNFMSISDELIVTSFETGNLGVWSVSSYKPDFGLDKLKDGKLNTYWQSSGPQPHFINISFPKKTPIAKVCLYLDYKIDESYTPSKIKIRYGTHFNDLQDFDTYEFTEPSGWITIPLFNKKVFNSRNNDEDTMYRQNSIFLKVFFLQISILANHLNGRDTHVRLIKLFSPLISNAFMYQSIPYNVISPHQNHNPDEILDILYKEIYNPGLSDTKSIDELSKNTSLR